MFTEYVRSHKEAGEKLDLGPYPFIGISFWLENWRSEKTSSLTNPEGGPGLLRVGIDSFPK